MGKDVELEIIEVENNQIVSTNETSVEIVTNAQKLELAKMLAQSTIVPISYQNRPENCFVAIDMASRMGVSPMVVMQNLYVIQGKPSWAGSAVGSMIRSHPRYKSVTLNYVGTEGKDDWGAYVSAEDRLTGKVVKGATVTIATAKKEGWYQKSGSKWQSMPELMLGYRAYSWFGRIYCPEVLMGLQSTEEIEDVKTVSINGDVVNPFDDSNK